MKKKLLFAVLPSLLVLAGCKPLAAEAGVKVNLMTEDTLAHEEIFGEVVELNAKKLSPRKLGSLDSDFVKIGYQIKYSDNGAADDTISIRFLAAIKDANVTAYWHRGLSKEDSTEGANPGTGWKYKFSDYTDDVSGKESTTIYSSLMSGSSTITAGAADTEYEDYVGFVIYTLKDIPYEDYKDSYLAAYVVLAEEGNSSNMVKSQALAVKIEKNDAGTASANRFFFDPDIDGKHFLQGTINDVVRDGSDDPEHEAVLLETEGSDGDAYYAKFKDVTMKSSDSFGFFYYKKHSNFQFFGKSSFFGESSTYLDSSSLAEYNSPKKNGNYSLLVHSGGLGNHVTTYEVGDDQTYNLHSMPDWIEGGVKVFAGYEAADSSNHWTLVSMSGTTGSFTAPNNIHKFWLVRCPTSTAEPSWSATGDNAGRIYNQTDGDLLVNFGYYTFGCSAWKDYNPQ